MSGAETHCRRKIYERRLVEEHCIRDESSTGKTVDCMEENAGMMARGRWESFRQDILRFPG